MQYQAIKEGGSSRGPVPGPPHPLAQYNKLGRYDYLNFTLSSSSFPVSGTVDPILLPKSNFTLSPYNF